MNETTLDLAPVRRTVDRLVGEAGGFTVWFQRLLQLSMVSTVTGSYEDFGAGRGARLPGPLVAGRHQPVDPRRSAEPAVVVGRRAETVPEDAESFDLEPDLVAGRQDVVDLDGRAAVAGARTEEAPRAEPDFKVPRRVCVIDELPESLIGKTSTKTLEAMALELGLEAG